MADMFAEWIKSYYSTGIKKSDDPLITSTSGALNKIYGAYAWSNAAASDNVFTTTKKSKYVKDGMRVETATGTESTGIAETGALADTDKPDWSEVEVGLKIENTTFEVSRLQSIKAEWNDAIGLDPLRMRRAKAHADGMDEHLLVDVDTLAGYNLESYDRISSAYAEIADASLTAGDADIYGIDRDASASWADGNYYGNGGTDRSYSHNLVLTAIAAIESNNGTPTKLITGTDTWAQIVNTSETQVRFNGVGSQKMVMTARGLMPSQEQDASMTYSSLYGLPIVKDRNVQKDTISRIYVIDDSESNEPGEPIVSLDVGKPSTYYEVENSVILDNPKTKGSYETFAELKCRAFFKQAKIRDLKT